MYVILSNITWDTEDDSGLPGMFISNLSTVEGALAEATAVYGFCIQDCEPSFKDDPTYNFIVIDPATRTVTERSASIPKTGLWSHLGRLALGLQLGDSRGAPCNRWLGTAVINGCEVDLMSFDEKYFATGKFKFVGEWKNENNSYRSGPIVILTSSGAGSTSLNKDVTAAMVRAAVKF